jgi:long-chain acyl-CoA synthetase
MPRVDKPYPDDPASGWNIAALVQTMAARGQHPAVVVYGTAGLCVTTSEALARQATAVANSLLQQGISRGEPIALWAPNSAGWVAAALGIMAAGATLVPVDELVDDAQLAAMLHRGGVRRIFASARHIAASADVLRDIAAMSVEAALRADAISCARLPLLGPDDTAVLSWTSGTTGAPKGFFLSYRNIATNVIALTELHMVRRDDHVLLPLPLHHAYPFVAGMLTPLAIGAPLALPADLTEPAITQALRQGDIGTIIGVPRLYEAILGAIDARITASGRIVRFAWRLLLRIAVVVQRHTGVRLGVLCFAGIRRTIAPRLHYLVAGGAKLANETTERLEALGWTVLCGYGLAETASLFTGNPPDDRCLASAGKPLADGEIRIATPDSDGIGEIELRGSSITKEYLNNPKANRTSFTSDGWFRTGDLGFVDRHGFLHVTGRGKEVLVVGGGKTVNPEDLEQYYAGMRQICEIAILEYEGRLVALVQPDLTRVHEMGTLNLREGIRVTLAERTQGLPVYQRLSGFALIDRPLPRTCLGTYRRFMLPELYRQALAGHTRREPYPLHAEDRLLLQDSRASAVWALLQEKYPQQAVDLDVNIGLELNADSFAWMEITIALQERFGVQLNESDIAGIETIRELLRCCADKARQIAQGTPATSSQEPAITQWLTRTGPFVRLLGSVLYGINWLVMRVVFRLQVRGIENLPQCGAFVITPNHASYLDPFVVAAALPWQRARQVYWAAFVTLLFSTRSRRLFSRAVHIFPVDERRPDKAIAAAMQVLDTGRIAVWFPEGWRSPDGAVQRFQPGIGEVLRRTSALVVPAYVHGTFETWPRHRRMPRPGRVAVAFGHPERASTLRAAGQGATDAERIATELRERVLAMDEPPIRCSTYL